MATDELTMLSFVGIYFLLLGGFVYNFYLSKRMYKLLENMGEIIALSANIPRSAVGHHESGEMGTMKKLIQEGMEIEREKGQ